MQERDFAFLLNMEACDFPPEQEAAKMRRKKIRLAKSKKLQWNMTCKIQNFP